MAIDRSLRRIAPYAWALLVTAVAALVRSALGPFLEDHYPLGTFYAAVAIIGWLFGLGPAVLAAILGYPVGAYLFLSTRASGGYFGLELIVYTAICSALIAFVHRIYERQRRLDLALAAHASTRHALAESDERFKRYLDALPDIVYTWKADGSTEYVNPRWSEIVGAESATDEAVAAHMPAEDAAMSAERRSDALRRGEPLRTEFRLRDRDGHLRWFLTRCVPIRDAKDSIIGWVGVSSDIDDEKRATEALELSERRYRSVSEAFDFGMWSADTAGRLTFVSAGYLDFLGVTLEQAEAQVWSAMQAPVDEIREAAARWEHCKASGESWDREYSLRGRDGAVRRVWSRGIPLRGPDGVVTSWAGFNLDVTERYAASRSLEEQLRHTNRRKDEFLATLAHELRNPLAPIRYATQLMKPGTPPEMAADARRMIDRQLAHMARLLDDLLDVSRITRGSLEIRRDAVDLRAILRQAVDAAHPLAEAVEQELRVELPNYALPVRGDETRLIQVFGNLINNAIKFTNAGGKILVSAAIDDAMIVASVRDTGRGISPELLPHVFEMFVQGDPSSRAQTGLGIGLSLAKQMIDLHGGRVEAHSDGPRRGSEFRVLLPRVAELPAMQESLVDSAKVSVLGAGGITVLIVDDNVDAADALTQFLKLAGYQTRVAYDGRTAVEMAEILEPMVVLLDLGLPYLDGYEVARRLRALPWGRTARLIALTGWGQEHDVQRSRESGFDEHFTKPVDPEVLLQRIIELSQGAVRSGN